MKLVDEGEYCPHCGEIPEEWAEYGDECVECHNSADYTMDECGCEHCLDRIIAKVDFMDYD